MMLKKIYSIIICITLGNTAFASPIRANEEVVEPYKIGAYCQMGKYNEEPILWRCVAEDENGSLFVSDKILCDKAFDVGEVAFNERIGAIYGSNFWEESTLRAWLNSTAQAGEVVWPEGKIPDADRIISNYHAHPETPGKYPYAEESGFLSASNFTATERAVMKTVSQWQALPEYKLDLAENGQTRPYLTWFTVGSPRHGQVVIHMNTIDEIPDAFRGAMYRLSDTMFLLNETQLYDMWKNTGEVRCKKVASISVENEEYGDYWLRTPDSDMKGSTRSDNINTVDKKYGYTHPNLANTAELGVRPAFYLNEENAQILSGSGSKTDPYILDGEQEQNGVTIFSQGTQLIPDQQPVEENGQLLLPMRTIFESLGAEVIWNDEQQMATARKDETSIRLQIDSPLLTVNEANVELDAAPRLIGDRTMVPLRAVSESLGAKVTYIENLQRVVVDQPEPQQFSTDWAPSWYSRVFNTNPPEYIPETE